MIKVINIDSSFGWEKHYLDPNKTNKWSDYAYYESPILEKFLSEGWTIKDFKMSSEKTHTLWTFILEKNDEPIKRYKPLVDEI